MKKLIIKTLLVLLPIVIANFIFGILRNQNGDEKIPYKQNLQKQFISRGQINKTTGKIISDSHSFDMSREVRKLKIVRYKDKWGFQNKQEIKNPNILFIGDSFFDDPYLPYNQGLSSNFRQSLNIGSMGCSGFKVYNELKLYDYFKKTPKYIIIEVVERNLNSWNNLYNQIKLKQLKTTKYNYWGLDLILGNNFKGANFENLVLKKNGLKPKKQGTLRIFDKNKNIYFYRNVVSQIDSSNLSTIIYNMKRVSDYFNRLDCQVIYVVAPDKESTFPEIFGPSQLPYIQKQFDKANIRYIDMYKAIMGSSIRKECYFDGDTHWNNNAYSLLIEKIKLEIKN